MSRAGRVAVGLLFAADCVVAAIALSDLVVNGGPVASSLIILTAASVAYATVGSILVARRPGNAIGWLLLALGLGLGRVPTVARYTYGGSILATALKQ